LVVKATIRDPSGIESAKVRYNYMWGDETKRSRAPAMERVPGTAHRYQVDLGTFKLANDGRLAKVEFRVVAVDKLGNPKRTKWYTRKVRSCAIVD